MADNYFEWLVTAAANHAKRLGLVKLGLGGMAGLRFIESFEGYAVRRVANGLLHR